MREPAGRALPAEGRRWGGGGGIDRLILPVHDDTFNNGEMLVSHSSWMASDRHNLRD